MSVFISKLLLFTIFATCFLEKSNCSERDSLFDFSSSFFLWETKSGSIGRFHIECVADILYEDYSERIVLLSNVMACDVYGKEPLFHNPSYLYEASFTKNEVKFFRTYHSKTANTVHRINEIFKSSNFHEEYCTYKRLSSISEIHEATVSGKNLIGSVLYKNKHDKTIRITFPIKHINISPSLQELQVETGKVLYYSDSFKNLRTAYLAFKNFDNINFLILDIPNNNIESFNAKILIYATDK